MEDDYFDHDYEDEEQLFNILTVFQNLGGNIANIKHFIRDTNQQLKLTIQNKREELNYLYES